MTCYSFNCSAHSRLLLYFCGNHSSFFVNDINRSLGIFLSLLAARESSNKTTNVFVCATQYMSSGFVHIDWS